MMADSIRKKSSRHSKIAGDFAEALVLYWLSKYGYECARIDHTGIDLIARAPHEPEVLGISVKCRDRYNHREKAPINLKPDGFNKARKACEAFGCVPYYAIVVDAAAAVRCFVLSLDHLETVVGGTRGGQRSWRMGDKDIDRYAVDPLIRGFVLLTASCSWRDSTPNQSLHLTGRAAAASRRCKVSQVRPAGEL
jgi:hypothetical protein